MSKPNTHARIAAMDIIAAINTDTWDYVRCAERIQDAIDKSILEPVPELKGSFPIVLHFSNAQAAREFTESVLAAKPELVKQKL